MICIGTGSMVHDEKRMRYTPELYFKSPDEMKALFAEVPEAISNTVRIADKCDLQIDFKSSKYPAYTPPEGKTREQYLRELCAQGLRDRYGERAENDKDLMLRMEYELGVMEKAGFVSYFLIVWDFISYARGRGIPVGPGRGSAAGSLVAYILGITDVDPLRFGLIFERFLNPERVSPPDIDIDFCMERRGEVIEYVRRKYGTRAVSQIVTFGTLSSKAVLKDVSRVLGMSYGDGDRLSKMIPIEQAKPLALAIAAEKNPDLKRAIETEPATRQVWDYALVLEGLTRGTGVHAAGVVIGDRDLDEYIPLARDKEEQVITQYSGGPLNDLGLLKMDFLGLKTLTVIEDALVMIRAREPGFDLETIAFDDPKTLAMLNGGETVGVFQLEGGGMTSLCKQFDITGIDDLLAISALYRPGPMDLIPDYIRRKRGLTKIKYEHPLLKEVCADTYGIMIYQEQVQRAASVLAGYTLGQADLLRRAMGKKDKEKMAKERARLHPGLRGGERHRRRKGQHDLRLAGKVCRLRLQQEPQRRLRIDHVPDRVFEGELPGRIHGRAVEQRGERHRQNLDLRGGVPAHAHPDLPARREQEPHEIHSRGKPRRRGGIPTAAHCAEDPGDTRDQPARRASRGHPVRTGGDQERRRGRRWPTVDRRARQERVV